MTTVNESVGEATTTTGSPSVDLLRVDGITVRFGGLAANSNVTLACGEGAITALLGPNGAGKTTLFDVITGVRRPTLGRVHFSGRDITGLPPYRRARLGIARTFQNLCLARRLSVFDNVFLGAARYRNYGPLSAALRLPKVHRNDGAVGEIASRAIDVVGLSEVAGVPAGGLSYGDLRRVELARALALDPRLLMLDEPAAGMDRAETVQLAEALLEIRARWGVTIFVVEHDIEFVRLVADRAYVLDFGQILAEGDVSGVLANQAVRDAYLGTINGA